MMLGRLPVPVHPIRGRLRGYSIFPLLGKLGKHTNQKNPMENPFDSSELRVRLFGGKTGEPLPSISSRENRYLSSRASVVGLGIPNGKTSAS